jgi:hypothetical protein
MDDMVARALHAARQHFDEGGFLNSLRGMFSGPEVLSTGDKLVDDGRVNWGNPENPADFARAAQADKALRLAREVQARADDVTGSTPRQAPLTAPRPGPVEERELPVNIPLNAPERGVSLLSSDISPASVTSLPLAYSPEPPKNPARAAIEEATKIGARAPQGPDLTDRDRDLIIRTIAAETSGKSPEESQAIAHVILNRIQSGKYGASPEAVLFARKQFEPWSNPNGANYPMRFTPESRRYKIGQEALDAALGAEDITKGATNFWAPKAQAALGRRPPKWGRTGGVDIGETRFHKLERAEGGLVDDALHVVREHHADGEAVGQAPVATDNSERVRAAESAANLAKQIQAYEASMASIRQQPQDIQSMTHAPEKPRAPISVEALGKNREFGSAPYDVAGPLSTLAQGAYDLKTAPLYAAGMAFPPAAALGTAIDTAEGVASGSPTQVAMGALGGPLKVARNVIAPLAVATGVTAPDEAEAAKLSKLLRVVSPEDRAANLARFMENAKTPPVLYHASHADIPEFKRTKGSHLGFHFGDVEAANNRLEDTAEKFPWPKADRNERYAISEGHFNKLKAYEDALRRKNTEVPMDELVRALDAGEDVGPIFKKYEYVPTLEEQAQLNALREAYQSSKVPIIPPGGVGANVGAYHVAITNPLRIPDVGNWGSVREIKKHLPFNTDARSQADLLSELKGRGYDGIVYQNRVENPVMRTDSFIAFDPEQAKSAIGNAGTFDPTKARLNEAKGGSVEDRALMLVSRQA